MQGDTLGVYLSPELTVNFFLEADFFLQEVSFVV